jgi:hypothetical protein
MYVVRMRFKWACIGLISCYCSTVIALAPSPSPLASVTASLGSRVVTSKNLKRPRSDDSEAELLSPRKTWSTGILRDGRFRHRWRISVRSWGLGLFRSTFFEPGSGLLIPTSRGQHFSSHLPPPLLPPTDDITSAMPPSGFNWRHPWDSGRRHGQTVRFTTSSPSSRWASQFCARRYERWDGHSVAGERSPSRGWKRL